MTQGNWFSSVVRFLRRETATFNGYRSGRENTPRFLIGAKRRRISGVMLDCLGFVDLQINGRFSSLLCLCGLSVSVVVYLLYTKFFYPRSYYSAILTKLVRRLLLSRSRERLAGLRTKRSAASAAVVPSNSTSGERPNDDDVSRTTESPCPNVHASSSVSSSRIVANGDDVICRVPPPSQLKCLPSGGRPSDRLRRRRTHSESLDLPRLDDFICRIPEIGVRPPKYSHGTRNVIDWLAQIAVEVDGEGDRRRSGDRFPDHRERDGGGDGGVGKTAALVGGVDVGGGHHRRGIVGHGDGGRPRRDPDVDGIEEIVVRALFGESEDAKKGPEIRGSCDESTEAVKEKEEKGVEGRGYGLRKSGAVFRRDSPEGNRWIDEETAVAAESEDETADLFHASEDTWNTPSRVFYFEDEDEEWDFTPGCGGGGGGSARFAPLHPGTQPSITEQQQRRQHQQQQQQQHDVLRPLNRLSLLQQPDDPTHPAGGGGGTGYEWLRARLLCPTTTRKRLTSTDSRASLELLAAARRGLTRNHFSFNSELSAASSDYTYRESLLSKGLSVDGGEDLDRLVIPGDDLLYAAADFSRWTLTDIDQLNEELDSIRRDIRDINSEVEVLQSREDLTDFAARYDLSGVRAEEERRNSIGYHSNTDLRMLQSSTLLGQRRRRRTRSASSIPRAAFDPEEGFRGCEPDDLNLHSAQGDGFAWDYDDPGLTPTPTPIPTHYALRRASNTFRLDEVQRLEAPKSNKERQFVFHDDEEEEEEDEEEDRTDWDEQLSRSSLSDCDEDPDVTRAEHPAVEYPSETDDEYIDDGYEVLTRFQR